MTKFYATYYCKVLFTFSILSHLKVKIGRNIEDKNRFLKYVFFEFNKHDFRIQSMI